MAAASESIPKRVAGVYARVSTDEQAKLGQSLAVQVNALEEYSKANGIEVYNRYVDEGFSGADFNRPGLRRLRDDAKAGAVNMVLATHLDRLGRDGPELLNLIYKEFKQVANVLCVFPTDGLASGEDRDELVIFIRAQQAAEFRVRLSQRTKASKVHLAEKGLWVGGLPPIGFELDRENHRLKVCPEEAALVKRVIDLSVNGYGAARIAHLLNQSAQQPVTARVYLPSPRYCRKVKRPRQSSSCVLRLHHEEYHESCVGCIAEHSDQARIVRPRGVGKSTVRRIQTQELYLGTMIWGRTKRPAGSPTIRNAPSEWIVAAQPTSEALITADQSATIKANRAANRIYRVRSAGSEFMLNGLLFCGRCGGRMAGHKDCRTWRAYFCSTRKSKGASICDAPTIRIDLIEPHIERRLREFVASVDDGTLMAGDRWLQDSALVTNVTAEISRLEAKIIHLDAAAGKVLGLYERGNEAPTIVRERLEQLRLEREQTEANLAQRRVQFTQAQADVPTREELLAFARGFDTVWGAATPEERRELVSAVFEKITAFPDGRIDVIRAF